MHGSAPDIAGTGRANPTAMLRSTALLLEHGLGRPDDAQRLAHAIDAALATTPTPDLGGTATTAELGAAVREQLHVDGASGRRTVREMRSAFEAAFALLCGLLRVRLYALAGAFASPPAAG